MPTAQKRTLILSLLLHLLLLAIFFFQAFKNSPPFVLIFSGPSERISLLPSKAGQEVVFDTRTFPQETPPVTPKEDEKETVPPEIQTALYQKKSDGGSSVYEEESTTEQTSPETPKKVLKQETAPQTQGTALMKEVELPLTGKQASAQEQDEITKSALGNLIKPKDEKKKPSSLARCYIDEEKGNSCIRRYGVDRVPGAEELKYICYEKEIHDHVSASWNCMYGTARIDAPERAASVTYLINQDGVVENLELIISSGSPTFDKMVLHCIQNTQFPPLPKHFGVKKYRPRGGYMMLSSIDPYSRN